MDTRSRNRWRVPFASLLALLLVLAACAPDEELQDDEEPTAEPDAAAEDDDDDADDGEDDGADAEGTVDEAETDDPIVIGVMAPLTGDIAAAGEDLVDGWELYWDQQGGEVAGREVVYEVEDTAGDPSVALTRAERLVDDAGADMLVGPILANIALAVGGYATDNGVPSFQPVAAADDLTQRDFDPLLMRTGATTSSQPSHPAGEWAYDQGYERVLTICPDYAFGHENCGGFARTFSEAGGEIVEQLWNPLGTQDFSSYMAQIQEADPDMVFVTQTSADAARFIGAWEEFGLKDQIPFIGNSTVTEQSVIRGLGEEAEGLQSFSYYAEGRDEPATQEFVEAYEEEHEVIPSLYAAGAYAAAEWIALALEEVEGDTDDTDAFVEAVQAIQLETPLGPMELDDYNNPIYNVYLREVVEREDGSLWNVPIETIPDVSQFWTYDPEEYLENPVYDRDYQGY